MTMYIVTGPPCAGKSTYVRQHAKNGDLRVDYDEIARSFGASSHSADGVIKDVAFAARDAAIDIAMKSTETDSYIIHTRLEPSRVLQYRGVGAEFVELDPGYYTCLWRAISDGRPQHSIDAIRDWYGVDGEKGTPMDGHRTKEFHIMSKADSGEAGTISGYFSTYDRIPDSYGDVVAKGAFTETIKEREESGHPFPLCWNHDLNQIIGKVDSIVDDEHGPLMTASFFNNALAQEKREVVKSGVVYQFSFAYDVLEEGPVKLEDGTTVNELRKLDLFEVSIVPIPANRNAEVVDVKSDTTTEESVSKVRLEASKEALCGILDQLQSLENMIGSVLLGYKGEQCTEEAEEESHDGNAEDAEDLSVANSRKSCILDYIDTIKER